MVSINSLTNIIPIVGGDSVLLVSCLIFRDHWTSNNFVGWHEESQSLRLSVSPERLEVCSTLEDQINRDQTLEKSVFYQNCPQHLQGEDKSSFSWEQTGQLLVRDEVKYSDVAGASSVLCSCLSMWALGTLKSRTSRGPVSLGGNKRGLRCPRWEGGPAEPDGDKNNCGDRVLASPGEEIKYKTHLQLTLNLSSEL